jgi:hypothetical protein
MARAKRATGVWGPSPPGTLRFTPYSSRREHTLDDAARSKSTRYIPIKGCFLETANDLVRRRQIRKKQSLEELNQRLGRELVEKTSEYCNAEFRTIQKALLDGYSRENCEQYFKSLEKASKEVYEDLIDNVDETGFSIGDTSKM